MADTTAAGGFLPSGAHSNRGQMNPTTELRDLPPRVLLVEDDDGDALLVEILLEEAFPDGVEIVRARDLDEATSCLRARADDETWCALVDLGLPDAQGFDALHAVREASPHDPVVVLTGLADDAKGLAAVAAGAQDYLVKGRVHAEDLRRSIRYALERCRADEAGRLLLQEKYLHEENVRLERGLLPKPLLEHHGALRWASRYRPGSNRLRIGGDFYDVVERNGVVHVVVGDVCGHGPDEAAIGVVLRVAWRALVRAGLPPEEVMEHLNDLMAVEALQDGQFTTLASLRLLGGGEVGMILAGHPCPFVIADGEVQVVECEPGPPLGVWPGRHWDEVVHQLPPSSIVLAYTDGLVEGRAAPGDSERLGLDGAAELLRRLVREAAAAGVPLGEAALDSLLEAIETLHGGVLDDDVALIAVELPTTVPAP
jgi:serine phosphatase RsbU (regulator of sigma subunit)/CheY-like chemotaxis protein